MMLLVAATTLEIAPLLSQMQQEAVFSPQYSRYTFEKKEIDVLITGVGMVATAFALGRVLEKQRYKLVVNAGICGSFNKNLPIGQVVTVSSDYFPELGAENGEEFLNLSELGLEKPENLKFYAKPIKTTLPDVSGATVNTAHGNQTSIERFLKQHPVDVESMEGAAVFYACKQANIGCVQIRAISNEVETRDKSKWNIPLAVRNLNDFLKSELGGW